MVEAQVLEEGGAGAPLLSPPPPHSLQELDVLGALDNTYIIFTGDNGFHLVRAGCGGGKGGTDCSRGDNTPPTQCPPFFLNSRYEEGPLTHAYHPASVPFFLQGQHSLSYQKYTPYEEDVRVPLFLRGPGVQAGVATDYQVSWVWNGSVGSTVLGTQVSVVPLSTALPALEDGPTLKVGSPYAGHYGGLARYDRHSSR